MYIKSVILDTPFYIKDYIHGKAHGQIHVGDVLYHEISNSIIVVLGEINVKKKTLRTDILGTTSFSELVFPKEEHFQKSKLSINKYVYPKLKYSHLIGDLNLISFGFHADNPQGKISHIMSLPCMPSQIEFENLIQIHSSNFSTDSWFEINKYSNYRFADIVRAKSQVELV